MARLTVNGLDALVGDLAEVASLPDSVIEELLNAEADVIEAEQRKTVREMLSGPYATGATAASIRKGKVKKTPSGKSITVAPKGTNKRGTRHAEVLFINEYGKKGQPARPAVRTANTRAEKPALDAGEKVFNDFLDKKGL